MTKLFDYVTATHVIVNGGKCARESWEENEEMCGLFVEVDFDGCFIVTTFDDEYVECYTPNVSDVQAKDWHIVEIEKEENDTRTESQIQFDEYLVEIKEIFECIGELELVPTDKEDFKRGILFRRLKQEVSAYENMKDISDKECENVAQKTLNDFLYALQDVLECELEELERRG